MNRWLFLPLVALGFTHGLVRAQDTAYKALRTIGAQRGEKVLSQVVSISGQYGRPQPVDWRIELSDPAARGGVREIEIVGGKITSERTPAHPLAPGTTSIDLTKLNVDSDNAFHKAEQEATRNQVGFDSVNYHLAVEGGNGLPVWTLELFDYDQRPVGKVRIEAGDAHLLSATNWVPGQSGNRPRSADEEALAAAPPPAGGSRPPEDEESDREYRGHHQGSSDEDSDGHAGETAGGRLNRYGSSVAEFGRSVVHRTTRVFQTVGGWFQEKFTGRNTIDPKRGQDEEEDQEPADSDRYNRPVNPEPAER